jgi:hypothetical protein
MDNLLANKTPPSEPGQRRATSSCASPRPTYAPWANPIEAQLGQPRTFTMGISMPPTIATTTSPRGSATLNEAAAAATTSHLREPAAMHSGVGLVASQGQPCPQDGLLGAGEATDVADLGGEQPDVLALGQGGPPVDVCVSPRCFIRAIRDKKELGQPGDPSANCPDRGAAGTGSDANRRVAFWYQSDRSGGPRAQGDGRMGAGEGTDLTGSRGS